MTFNITLTAEALVFASVTVEAASLEEAQAKAIQSAKEGNALWTYDNVQDGTIEVGE